MIRRSPLRRKSAKKKRSRAARCSVRGCKRPAKVTQVGSLRYNLGPEPNAPDIIMPTQTVWCLTHAKREADRLFSLKVRAVGACERCESDENLQCSHFISRRYLGVRYVRLNAECLCAACHKFLTERPLEAEQRAIAELGAHAFEELKRLALAFTGPVDWAAVLASLAPSTPPAPLGGQP